MHGDNFYYCMGAPPLTFYPLEKLHQLYDGYKRAFRVNRLELLLIHEDGRSYLIENRCPHMDAPLARGTVQGGYIRCPMHGISFDIKTGSASAQVPGAVGKITLYTPVYEGNVIGVVL